MNQSSETADQHAKVLDEALRRIVMSMPDKPVDVVGLRSELSAALENGATTLFHLFKIGRDCAARSAGPADHRPELVDRQWVRDRVTGSLFEMGWQMDGKPAFIRAVDRTNQPAKPSPQQIADMCRGAERMRRSA